MSTTAPTLAPSPNQSPSQLWATAVAGFHQSVQDSADRINAANKLEYDSQTYPNWKAQKDNDANYNAPEPQPPFLMVVNQLAPGDPSSYTMPTLQLVNSVQTVEPLPVYVPPRRDPGAGFAPLQQNDVISAPKGDMYPEGFIMVDQNGNPWYKHWGISPFLVDATGHTPPPVAPGALPANPALYVNEYESQALYNVTTGKTPPV